MKENTCCSPSPKTAGNLKANDCKCSEGVQILPMTGLRPASMENSCHADTALHADEPCCGPPPSPRSSPHERPGYSISRFVDGFLETPAGAVPRVKTKRGFHDFAGTLKVRSGFSRNDYKVSPGLYAIGNPEGRSPVLVTANYKLGFDKLRSCLKHTDAWMLVVDTRAINVWCAGGKELFSAGEIIRQVRQSGLARVVEHRKLVLPQLSANGVSGRDVKKGCGFSVIWGPVRADDIEAFIAGNMEATDRMRRVTFDIAERLVLIPVELSFVWKPTLFAIAAIFVFSGIGPEIFSVSQAVNRGGMPLAAYGAGIFSGAVLTPALLPWIPGRAFSVKGIIAGMVVFFPLVFAFRGKVGELEVFTLLFIVLAVSSWLAMNFTGSTPYTSPSGVEKEMRISMPLQTAALFAAVFFWVAAAFA